MSSPDYRTSPKTKQIVGRRSNGDASVLKTYVSETVDRGPRDAPVCRARVESS
jgi:hypothetical protein